MRTAFLNRFLRGPGEVDGAHEIVQVLAPDVVGEDQQRPLNVSCLESRWQDEFVKNSSQNVDQNIFVKLNAYLTLTVEKVSPKQGLLLQLKKYPK
jgi:hypothetical protein